MRGSIRRRGKGSWELTIDLGRDPATGRRLRRFHAVRGTRRDAERELAAHLHALATGTYADPSKETVAAYLERWLRDYAEPTVAPRTFERYAEIVRGPITAVLGSMRLSSVRAPHIAAAERQWRDAGLAPATVLKYHRLIRQALAHAVRWHLLVVNPADAVAAPRTERREMAVLTPEQATALLDAARGTEFEVPLTTALYTGLRLGELLGLRWRDADLGAGQLRVQQTLQQVAGGGVVFRQPKTHRSRRAVSIPTVVVDSLREHRRAQAETRLLAGPAWADTDLVFSDALGRPLSANRLRWHFHRLLREAGLPRIRLHDLRHTMATLMLAAGEHPKVVSERLGHSTIAVTIDTYSHVLPGLQAAAAERLADVLGGSRQRSAEGPDQAP
jgi:integrase